MLLRPFRIFRSRICRILGVAFLLAAAWWAWSVWPPQPELRVAIQTSRKCSWGQVTVDGRSVVCTAPPTNLIDKRGRQVDVFELATGERRLTFTDENKVTLSLSPNGSCLAYIDGQGELYCHLRELPSGRLILTLPKIEENWHWDWTPDGRHFLFFNPKLSVYRADNGECVGRFGVSGYDFACRPNGSGFVAQANERELLVHSFDAATPETTVPLPGPPAFDPHQPDKRPADGSVSIDKLATTNDGSVIFTYVYRHHQEGDKDRRRRYLARWDRSTQQWSEVDMGPVPQSFTYGVKALRLSANGRYLATNMTLSELLLQGYFNFLPTFERDNWGEEEAKRFANRNLWDATSNPPRCAEDEGFPSGMDYFDPTGRRGLSFGTVYDAEARSQLSSQIINMDWWHDDPVFSADGRWVAFPERSEPWQPTYLPERVADWINKFLRLAEGSFCVIRLADGKMVRRLHGRASPTLTADGFLWTVTEADRIDDTVTLNAERWTPEPPGPPWWLMLFSAGSCGAVVWDVRRRRPSRLSVPSKP